jgi:hypothetical protein
MSAAKGLFPRKAAIKGWTGLSEGVGADAVVPVFRAGLGDSTGVCTCGSRFFAQCGIVVFTSGAEVDIGGETAAVGSLYICFVSHVGFAVTAEVVAVEVVVDAGTYWAGSALSTSTTTAGRSSLFLFIAHFGTDRPVVGEDWDPLGIANVSVATAVDVLTWDG